MRHSLLHQKNPDQTGVGPLVARAVAGGAERQLATQMYDVRVMTGGTGVVVLANPDDSTGDVTYDIKWVDAVAGGTPTLIAQAVAEGSFEVSGKRFVFTTGAGLFSTPLP